MEANTTKAPYTLQVTNDTTPACCRTSHQERERLELQARKVAGSLVLAGLALGLLVSPYGFGLSALVGAGLIFSGITNTCPMATLLGKLPGNSCCSTAQEC